MTSLDSRSLQRQTKLAAERMASAPEWQRNLINEMVARPGTDTEPTVSPVVVDAVRRALHEDAA